jgi:hypothetical protein
MAAKPRPFKRAGLHRLECPDCPCYGYFTVAMLEAAGGLPACFAVGCGARMMPTELELAVLLDVDAPVVREYESECGRIAHGQAWSAGNGRGIGQAMRELEAPEMKAAARLAARRRDVARSNRLRAIAPVPTPMPF